MALAVKVVLAVLVVVDAVHDEDTFIFAIAWATSLLVMTVRLSRCSPIGAVENRSTP